MCDYLAQLVLQHDASGWGIGLETLAQEREVEVLANLWSRAESLSRGASERDQIVLAALRGGVAFEGDWLHAYVRLALEEARALAWPLLGQCLGAGEEWAVSLASRRIAALVSSGRAEELSGYVPGMVRHAYAFDPHLPAALVQRVAAIDAGAGREFLRILKAHLTNTWVRREIPWLPGVDERER